MQTELKWAGTMLATSPSPNVSSPVQRKFDDDAHRPSLLSIQQNSPGVTAHRIAISPTLDKEARPKRSSKGPLFDAKYEGQLIVIASTEPCIAAARLLKARGLTGKLEMWDTVLPYCRFRADIDKAAGLTIEEGDSLARLRKYRVFSGRDAQDGDFASWGIPVAQTAESRPTDSPGTRPGEILAG